MSRRLNQCVKAMMPAPVKDLLATISRTRFTVDEMFSTVGRHAARWDEAAVQLDQLQSEVRRIGYPQYLYGLLCAARTANAIGAHTFTAIEFGVAGGNGLVALERHAMVVEKQWGLSIEVIGFDTSVGLPTRTDPRDCPFAFRGGEFRMDEAQLRSRLQHAQLRLGDVAETVRSFASQKSPPIGFISNDLDLYTSTMDSFRLLDLEPERLLPRVTMYFDDLIGYPYSTISGEWAAIRDFNSAHMNRQFGQIYGLRHCLGRAYRFAAWTDQFFMLHLFDHPSYNCQEVMVNSDLSLRTKP